MCDALLNLRGEADNGMILQAAGIKDGTIRVAVGIENADDLIADFQQALSAIGKARVSTSTVGKGQA